MKQRWGPAIYVEDLCGYKQRGEEQKLKQLKNVDGCKRFSIAGESSLKRYIERGGGQEKEKDRARGENDDQKLSKCFFYKKGKRINELGSS